MRQRLAYLVLFYLTTVLWFVAGKTAFMVYNAEAHPFTAGDLGEVLLHGLTLDLSTALYFLLLPFVAAVVSLWWDNGRMLRRLLTGYNVVAALALVLGVVADASLYPFWGFKLNASCLQYLDSPKEAAASVSAAYLVGRLLAVVLLTAGLALLYGRLTPRFRRTGHRIAATAVFLLSIPLMVIGIRGGLDESTTNVGQVYFSQEQYLNHAAINPVFSFLSSFEHSQKEYDGYAFFSEQECQAILRDVYSTESVGADTLLNNRRPHVVVILMEGAGAVFTELGGHREVMPRLSQLTHEGICFTQCYANSWRTDRGTVCTLSGWPSFPNTSVMKMPEKSRTMPSIAKTLRQEGYQTSYLYGGDINFTNMRGYLLATGWEKLVSMDDYSRKEQQQSKWGVPDDVTFNTLYTMLTTATDKPQLIGFSTLSSHEPWKVPMTHFDDEVLNAFYYLDDCIGRFIDRLRATPLWENTLVVLLPDHGIQYKQLDETQPLRNQIPVVWTGGAVKQPRRINVVCNQSDMAATLLGQLGLAHDDFTFSRDVLSQTYRRPFAVHNYNNAQSMADSTGFILYDFDADRYIVRQSREADRMLRLSKAVLQVTTDDLKHR